jgi:hypothetical protein
MSTRKAAVKELLAALKSDDEGAASEALESFVYSCMDEEPEDEEDGDKKPVLGIMIGAKKK